jgi:type I restriction enzyme S subunit
LHYSIPALDETGGPLIELGQAIESNKFLLTEPCILVSKLNPRKSRVCMFKPENRKMPVCASTEFIIYIPSDSDSSLDFFAHYMASEPFRQRLERIAIGTTNSHVRARPPLTLKWEIQVPPRAEQEAIARILNAVDVAIDRTRTAIATAQRLKQAVLQKVFGAPASQATKLGKYITEIQYGTSQASNDKGWGHPTLRIPNIIGGIINTTDLTCVDAPAREVGRYLLRAGDLLLVRTNGNPSFIGRSAVFSPPDERQWLYASYLIRVRFNEQVVPRYVDEYLKSGRGRRELFRRVTTSAGNYNINTKSIRSIPINLPPRERQLEVVRLTDAANMRISVLERHEGSLERLKRGLMQDLLSGRVRVLLPADGGTGAKGSHP